MRISFFPGLGIGALSVLPAWISAFYRELGRSIEPSEICRHAIMPWTALQQIFTRTRGSRVQQRNSSKS